MIKIHNALFADVDILDKNSGNAMFSSDEMDILSVDFNNIKVGNRGRI